MHAYVCLPACTYACDMCLHAQQHDTLTALLSSVFGYMRFVSGSTALHLASVHGLLKTATVLLEKGALVSTCDSDGYTPLHVGDNDAKVPLYVTVSHSFRTGNFLCLAYLEL